jgi:hypothetical protein
VSRDRTLGGGCRVGGADAKRALGQQGDKVKSLEKQKKKPEKGTSLKAMPPKEMKPKM